MSESPTARGAGLNLSAPRPSATRRVRRRRRFAGVLWVLPAIAVYAAFVLYPLSESVRYSFYDRDGIGVATWVGYENYLTVFRNPELFGAIVNSFILILFFTIIPVTVGLIAAALIQSVRSRLVGSASRVILFLPQVVPLAAAAIAWVWMYSKDGAVNGLLRAIGLGGLENSWLANFDTALPAVGFIGTWVSFGLTTLLFSAGIGKIDPSLYEAAELDGAGPIRVFRAITVPALRPEIVVAATILTISALGSFDIVYVSTAGGPGFTTMVPGVLIYRLIFTAQQVGLASALAVLLTALIVVVILPLQRFARSAS